MTNGLGRPGEPDVDDPLGRLPTSSSAFAGSDGAFEASITASHGQVRQVLLRPNPVEPERHGRRTSDPSPRPPSGGPRPRRRERTSRRAARWCLGRARGRGPPGAARRPHTARRALPPGSTSAPSASSTESGSARRGERRHRDLLRERARAAAADEELGTAASQTCWRPVRQRRQTPAAQHRVARDAAAEPARGPPSRRSRTRCPPTRGRCAWGTPRTRRAGTASRP